MVKGKVLKDRIKGQTIELFRRGFPKEMIIKEICAELFVELEKTPHDRVRNLVETVVDNSLSEIDPNIGSLTDREKEYYKNLAHLKKKFAERKISNEDYWQGISRLENEYGDDVSELRHKKYWTGKRREQRENKKKKEDRHDESMEEIRQKREKVRSDKERKEHEEYQKKLKSGKGFSVLGHGGKVFSRDNADDVSVEKGFESMHWAHQRDAWIAFYNQEMENLRTAYEKGDIDAKQFRDNTKALKDYVNQKMPKRGKWSWRSKRMSSHHYMGQMRKVAYLLAAIVVGVAVTATTGSWFFLVGFMGVGVYLVAPDTRNIDQKPGQKIGLSSILLFHPETRSKQNTAGFLKSLGKVTAIAFFAFGFNNLGDVFHLFYIATAVIGYFLLKVEYSDSSEFIESLMRFFLGIILIPWIFNDIFDSLVLAGIAFAFFAVPPLPDESNKNIGEVLSRGLSGATAYYEMAEKFIFAIIMVIVGIASGAFGFIGITPAAGWQLTGALQYTFLYFWIVCGIAGFFSPAKERPITGGIMLGAATIIYGIGPGSQQVGSGLLGQWWPSVHNTFTSFTEPMSNLMGDIGGTFSQGFLLLTNPVGYATQLMNGTYASNPTGQTGAFGLEMEELSITGIYPEQPFVVTSILKNQGAYPAGNVYLSILAESPDKYSTTGSSRTEDSPVWRSESMIDIGSLGFLGQDSVCKDSIPDESVFGHENMETKVCMQYYEDKKDNELERQMVWQASFSSQGIGCDAIVGNSLRKKFIPITVKSEYDYESDSRVDVEFISEDEWQRLAQAGQLDSQFHLVESSYSTAPVIFPIGTAGLKNPILSSQDFHISLKIASAYQSNSGIVSIEEINVSFPAEWEPRGGSYDSACAGGNTRPMVQENQNGKDIVTWEGLSGGNRNIVCYFDELGDGIMGSAPTKSFLVTAHARYRFSRWMVKDTRIEFGGFCCPDNPGCTENCESDDCADGQVCLNNACVSGGTSLPPAGDDGDGYIEFGEPGWCGKYFDATNIECEAGMGGCHDTDECDMGGEVQGSLDCRFASDLGISICCPENDNIQDCVSTFNEIKDTYSRFVYPKD